MLKMLFQPIHIFFIRITRSRFKHKANGKTFREIAKKMNWLSIDAIFARSHQFKRKFLSAL